MKKIFIIIFIILVVIINTKKSEEVIIPYNAIRFRVIAASDKVEDQQTKVLVRNDIQEYLYNDLKDTTDLEKARTKINENIPKYQNLVEKTLTKNKKEDKYTINYGLNYFPEKVYRGVKYNEGYYESMVITLGNGLGENWWCVLFPPLCLLEAEETLEETEVEYKFFIKEVIDKYF